MEFTKLEQRILSTKHETLQKSMLVPAVLFFIISIAPIPYEMVQIKKANNTWDKAYSFVNEQIKPETKKEVFLKSMLLKNINETKEIMLNDLKQKMVRDAISYFFWGCLFLMIYFMSSNYLRLIRKLNKSQRINSPDPSGG